MSRRSTVAVSTLVPALKVRSTTLPVSTFFSVVRTKAPPLPGLTCWKAVTVHSWPSMLSTRPFLRSFVVATGGFSCVSAPGRASRLAARGSRRVVPVRRPDRRRRRVRAYPDLPRCPGGPRRAYDDHVPTSWTTSTVTDTSWVPGSTGTAADAATAESRAAGCGGAPAVTPTVHMIGHRGEPAARGD